MSKDGAYNVTHSGPGHHPRSQAPQPLFEGGQAIFWMRNLEIKELMSPFPDHTAGQPGASLSLDLKVRSASHALLGVLSSSPPAHLR